MAPYSCAIDRAYLGAHFDCARPAPIPANTWTRHRSRCSTQCATVSKPAKAKGVHARYQWDLSGPQGGQWWIDVDDGKYKMGKGKIDNPNVTFVATDKDWVAVSNHQLGGTWAYLTGQTKDSRRPGIGEKTRRNIPLEFRSAARIRRKEQGSVFATASARKKSNSRSTVTPPPTMILRYFNTRISYLHPSAILAVLNDALCNCNFLSVVRTSSVRKLV